MHPRTLELLQHLDRHHASLRQAVDSVPPERREIAPAQGEWSVANVLEHVAMVNTAVARTLGQKLASARAGGLAAETDSSPLAPGFDIRPLLNRNVKITAAEFVRPTCTVDAGTALQRADESHRILRGVLTIFDGLALGQVSHPHPVFGNRNVYEWFLTIGGHTARHAAQVREIGSRLAPDGMRG